MNLKQEISTCKALITKYQNQLTNCYNEDLKRHLKYQLQQEQIKLESYELLLDLYKKVGRAYE